MTTVKVAPVNSETVNEGNSVKVPEIKRLQKLLSNFADHTACHGIAHIHRSRYYVIKVIWTLMFLGAMGMVVLQLYDSVERYCMYPVKTLISVQHTALPFPTVTVCNVNPIRMSQSDNAPTYLTRFLASVNPDENVDRDWDDNSGEGEKSRKKRFIDSETWKNNYTDDEFIDYEYDGSGDVDFEDADPTATLDSMYRQFIIRVNQTIRYKLAHQLSAMLLSCSFDGHKCTAKNFTRSLSHEYGACYSFNVEKDFKENLLTAYGAGGIYGLSLMLYLESAEYIPGLTQGYGFRVSVSRTGILAFPETNGLFVSAGSETDVGLRLTNISRLAAPYSDCIDDEKFKKIHNFRYSRQHCQTLCEHNNTAKACGCYKRAYREFYSAKQLNDLPRCAKSDTRCINRVLDDMALEDYAITCNCPSPCLEYVYETVLSSRQWPENAFMNFLLDEVCRRVPNHCDDLYKMGEDELRKNFAKLNIFYRDLNYEKIEDSPEITATNLLSASGGIVAFWIGMSVLSLAELVQLFLQIIIFCMHLCFSRCTNPHLL